VTGWSLSVVACSMAVVEVTVTGWSLSVVACSMAVVEVVICQCQ